MMDMTIEKLSNKERWDYHANYRSYKLFVQWERIHNSRYEERYTMIDTTSLWKYSSKVLQELRYTTHDRAEMVMFLIDEMERTNPNKRQVETVMAIVFTQLANAQEEGRTHETHPNDEMCRAITRRFYKPGSFFKHLIESLRKLDKDDLGRDIIIPPHDPMIEEVTIEDVPKTMQEEIDRKLQNVLDKTDGMKPYFGSEWSKWEKLWTQILMNEELFFLFDDVNPTRNEWGVNLKMILNVVGLFNTERNINAHIKNLNDCLGISDRRKYISHCQDTQPSICALSQEQIKRIKAMIKTL